MFGDGGFGDNLFGGLFDFNRDGKEDLGELWIAYNIFNGDDDKDEDEDDEYDDKDDEEEDDDDDWDRL